MLRHVFCVHLKQYKIWNITPRNTGDNVRLSEDFIFILTGFLHSDYMNVADEESIWKAVMSSLVDYLFCIQSECVCLTALETYSASLTNCCVAECYSWKPN